MLYSPFVINCSSKVRTVKSCADGEELRGREDRMRLLLAEDERELSEALTAIFEHNHYEVDAVYNGTDALDYILVGDYDGVVLDVMMPGMDGFEVLKKVREQKNDVPILMLTAKADIDDRVFGLENGADDYLGKPFAAKELLARVRAITRRKTEALATRISVGNIELDEASGILTGPKEEIRLPNKEFQMLEMLMNNPKQIISADRFLEKIWGYDTDSDVNVVWVMISYLRKKLAKAGANVQIKAVRNQGYTLEVSD